MLAQRFNGGSNLWIADATDPNQPHKITADGSGYDDLSWTLDGRILHSEGDIGKSNLSILNSDGTGAEHLTDDKVMNRWPVMSPNGQTIVCSSKRSGQRQIWRMDSDGRNAKQLTDYKTGERIFSFFKAR